VRHGLEANQTPEAHHASLTPTDLARPLVARPAGWRPASFTHLGPVRKPKRFARLGRGHRELQGPATSASQTDSVCSWLAAIVAD